MGPNLWNCPPKQISADIFMKLLPKTDFQEGCLVKPTSHKTDMQWHFYKTASEIDCFRTWYAPQKGGFRIWNQLLRSVSDFEHILERGSFQISKQLKILQPNLGKGLFQILSSTFRDS